MIDLTKNLATMNRRTKSSVIRELLKLTNRPEIISFAGGLPNPSAFPTEHMAEITMKVIKERGREAFQYGSTEGTPFLKDEIIKMLKEDEGISVKPENILIVTASQQGLDLVGRTFIDPSDPIIVELPSYIGGLQVFGSYGAKMIGVHADDNGMKMDELEKKLQMLRNEEEHYKFIYLVPDFQNPSGVTMTLERRQKIVDLSREYNVLLVEDSPYRQIRFEGKAPPMLYSLDKESNVISLFTFSKTLVPGFRLGFVVAHESIIKKFTVLKQSIDLCTSPMNQLIAAEFMKQGLFKEHLPKIVSMYKAKKDLMIGALERYMPANEGISWTKPEGGLFLWLKLPEYMNMDTMFKEAIKEDVAYVIGSAFHCDGSGQNTARLNFSYSSDEQIEEGIKRLARVVTKNLKKK